LPNADPLPPSFVTSPVGPADPRDIALSTLALVAHVTGAAGPGDAFVLAPPEGKPEAVNTTALDGIWVKPPDAGAAASKQ